MAGHRGFSVGLALLSGLVAGAFGAYAQNAAKPPAAVVAGIPVNYDEAHVGTYTLPDPLTLADGERVRDSKIWYEKRRPEILRLFEEDQFGRAPGRPAGMSFDVFDQGTPALHGTAVRRQVTIYFSKDKNGPKEDLLLYLPAGATKPVPVLLNLSFSANSKNRGRSRRAGGHGVGARSQEGLGGGWPRPG